MPSAKFLQISDVHLGCRWGWLPPSQRGVRRREQQRVLEAAVSLAIERGVQAILLPGDLFDLDGVDAETQAFAIHAFGVAGCPPVFIAPGNHDPWHEASPCWSPRLLAARGWAWPKNVHVFTSASWSGERLTDSAIEIWGRSCSSGVASTERPLAPTLLNAIGGDPAVLRVGVFHGSREGFLPPGQKMTAPFSDDETSRSPFAYLAVGHYHRPSQLDYSPAASSAGGVRLAYAGSTVALGVTELGAHGALEIRIEHGAGPARVEAEFIALDRRRVHDVAADVTGASSADQIDGRIEAALDQAGAAEGDIATVTLTGRLMRGVRFTAPASSVRDRFFHLRTILRDVRPDYDLDAYRRGDAGTTEERFARALLERLDAESDPAERAVIERALYYGLDAFVLRDVFAAYEEIGG